MGAGYPYTPSIYTPAPTSAEWRALDTNGDGKVDVLDDPYTPFWPGADVVDWVAMSVCGLTASERPFERIFLTNSCIFFSFCCSRLPFALYLFYSFQTGSATPGPKSKTSSHPLATLRPSSTATRPFPTSTGNPNSTSTRCLRRDTTGPWRFLNPEPCFIRVCQRGLDRASWRSSRVGGGRALMLTCLGGCRG